MSVQVAAAAAVSPGNDLQTERLRAGGRRTDGTPPESTGSPSTAAKDSMADLAHGARYGSKMDKHEPNEGRK